jgi:F-type H+-transporting ATPase subunit gamma
LANNARDIRRRIRSIKNTQQITKAMEMVSAAKLRRAQEKVAQSRIYAEKIEEVAGKIASAAGANHPLLVKRPVARTGYLVISADKGLAGSYNAQVIRHAVGELRGRSRSEYVLYVIGRKARDFFRKRGYEIAGEITGLSDYPSYHDIRRIAEDIIAQYTGGVYDELYLIYNQFISPLSQVPVTKRILPLEDMGAAKPGEERAKSGQTLRSLYIYEPSAEAVLNALLPKYAETLIYNALLEAKASEHGARMTAMGNATDNAAEFIEQLTLALNRARQAAITMQIMEIVGGAEALK